MTINKGAVIAHSMTAEPRRDDCLLRRACRDRFFATGIFKLICFSDLIIESFPLHCRCHPESRFPKYPIWQERYICVRNFNRRCYWCFGGHRGQIRRTYLYPDFLRVVGMGYHTGKIGSYDSFGSTGALGCNKRCLSTAFAGNIRHCLPNHSHSGKFEHAKDQQQYDRRTKGELNSRSTAATNFAFCQTHFS